jgi:hypothetical protein
MAVPLRAAKKCITRAHSRLGDVMKLTARVLLVCAAVVACAETPTSPMHPPAEMNAFILSAGGHAPPPPDDTSSFSASTPYGTSSFAGATFFVNKTANNAWITFRSADGVVASPNARLAFHQNGKVQGKGSISYAVSGGTVTLDLGDIVLGENTVIDARCLDAPVVIGDVAGDVQLTRGPVTCASLPFTGGVFTSNEGGVSAASGVLNVYPGPNSKPTNF